jgi:hypothetical protein
VELDGECGYYCLGTFFFLFLLCTGFNVEFLGLCQLLMLTVHGYLELHERCWTLTHVSGGNHTVVLELLRILKIYA